MRAKINGKLYDTEQAHQLANWLTYSNTIHALYQTKAGDFFLALKDYVLDGRRLGTLESFHELAPELQEDQTETAANRLRRWEARELRVRIETRIIPMAVREAVEWVIRTNVPECFRGVLLESLP
ncbi:MAG: hypothetical protein ABI651_11240 [Verrucomicrobiota bacterium]